ncbi:MAG: DUF4388 domain-containing protein [Streptosporangiaceae bacterium]
MTTEGSEDGPAGPLREALTVCAAAGMSGTLRVTGHPGGAIHLVDGRVVAIETPGAPSPEVLLLRSHRITESDWDTAFAAAAVAGGRMSAELIAREMVGSGELEGVLRTALADAMFVLASGTVEEYRSEPGPVDFVLPVEPGAETEWLLAETSRRIRVLASLPDRYDLNRVMAAPGAAARPGVRLVESQDEILALADGRRTPRDIAFALGQGVFATILQLARLREAGLLVTASRRMTERDRREPGHQAPGDEPGSPSKLPRRQRDRSALLRNPKTAELRAPLRLLQPRFGRSPGSGETP